MVTRFVSLTATTLLALLSNSLAAADRPVFCGTERWHPLIAEASARSGLPEQWLHAIMRSESGGCAFMNERPTTSSAGAMGLMQLMPTTWLQMSRQLRLGDDPYQPHDNILAGAEYLRELYDRYGSPGFIAAYQAGPERYEDALQGSRALPTETVDYVARVLRFASLNASPLTIRATDSVVVRGPFITRETQRQSAAATLDRPLRDTLFVDLTHTHQPPERHVGGQPDVQDQ
jgi:soluble lytic murein transglycosylase-like protein